MFDDGADGGVFGREQREAAGNFDDFADLADFEVEIDAGGLLDLEFDIGAAGGFEAGFFGFDFVEAGDEGGDGVDTVFVGGGVADAVGGGIADGNCRTGDDVSS